jgi:peptidoglycan/LPS O-acetylase OafA/YrhL
MYLRTNNSENNFDFLRLFAAILVIIGHAYPLSDRGTYDFITLATAGIFSTAHHAVCIFFSISGYLICQSVQNSSSYSSYLWKRSLRIFPGLFVAIFLTVIVLGPLVTQLSLADYFQHHETLSYFKMLKMYPFYTDSLPSVFQENPVKNINGSLWTLAYEFTMYLVLLILHITKILSKRSIVLVLFVLGLFLEYYITITNRFSTIILPILHLNFTDLLDFGLFFFTGTLIKLYRDKIPFNIIFFMIAIIIWFGLGLVHVTSPISIKIISYIALPYIVFYLGFQKGFLNSFGRYGDFSYGFYIYAFPVQQLIVYYLGKNSSIFVLIMLTIICVIPLSYCSWHVVEKKFLKLKNVKFR